MTYKTRWFRILSGALILTLLLANLPLALGAPQRALAQTETVFINEIHYDNASTDTGEAIEIAGPAGTDLTGWSIVLYNGSNGAVYDTDVLNGEIPDLQNGFGVLYLTYPSNGIQNGAPDGIALVDNSNTVIQFLSYEGAFTAVGGPADGMLSVDIGVSQTGSDPVGESLQLSGTGTVYGDFIWVAPAANTFGAINTGQTFEGGVVTPADPVLNEFSASTAGTDVEFVEIFGDPNTDYSAYTLLEIEGDSGTATGTVDEVIPVGTTDTNGFGLINLASNALENGSITLLLVKDFTGAFGTDLDADNDGVFDETPWSAMVDAVAVNDGGAGDLTYGVPVLGVSYDGLPFAPGGASRIPDGFDTDTASDWMRNDFDLAGIPGNVGTPVVGEAINTPGAPNLAFSLTDPVINEFSASTAGTDVEFVEIFGDPNTDYSAYSILEIEGDSGAATGTVDEVIPVGTTDANGFWLINLAANALENGSITLLLVKDFTGALTVDLDADNDGVFDATPWSAIVDAVAVNDGGAGDLTYGAPVLGVSYDGLPFAPGGASRFPDGFDTDATSDWVRNDFDLAGIPGFAGTIVLGEAYNTPGAPNAVYVLPPEACGDPYTPIFEVQGATDTSPFAGIEVSVEGVVVGDFQNNASSDNGNLNGFHIQDPMGDGNPGTSDGVFIYASAGIDVAIGDAVRVRGAVSEYNGMTEITASQIWLCGTGSISPTPLSLPVTSVGDFEAYEGMLVIFPQNLVISEYFNFDRYGEIVLTSQRHLTPTAEYEPGPDAIWAADQFLLDRITLDDGRTNQNPDPAIHPNGQVFDLNNLFRGGDLVQNVTGVLDYSFDLYRIQPTQGANYIPVNGRPIEPDDVGGYTKVASFNVLNYFTTIDRGSNYWICGPNQDQECRGADSDAEFTRQRAKIIAALSAIDADVVGLIEIENHPLDVPTADLVSGLNEVMGADTYAYIPTGAIGTDAIRTALIYKPGRVSPLNSYAILDSSVDPRFLDDYNRPVLAQTFQDLATEEIFTVAVNHLKSKGSDCNAIGDPDLGDGAGNCNLTRLAAAQALVDWLAADPTFSGDADFLIIGDLNSYDKEDPIDAILAAGYADLIFQYQGEAAYSYVFDGQTGYLDHALASAGMVGHVTGATIWHINADEADLIDYDMSFKADAQDAIYAPDAYRSSDHDPVIIGICEATPPELIVELNQTMLWPPNHKYVTIEAYLMASDNADPDPTVTLISVTSNEPDDGLDDGDTPNDIVIVDNDTIMLRAERSGTGTGRIYTITYQVTDDCGNSQIVEATVTVPVGR